MMEKLRIWDWSNLQKTSLLPCPFVHVVDDLGGALPLSLIHILADPVILMQMTRRFSRCCKYIHKIRIFLSLIHILPHLSSDALTTLPGIGQSAAQVIHNVDERAGK